MCLHTLPLVLCPLCSLPPVPQEPTSDQEAVPGVSTDPYEDFAFETDTTGEEDEAQGSGGKSESDPLQDSKGGVSTSENAEVERPTTDQPVPAAPDVGPGAADSDSVPLVNGVGLFDGAELETFEGRLAPPDLAKETFVPVYVSYVSSPTDFWVSLRRVCMFVSLSVGERCACALACLCDFVCCNPCSLPLARMMWSTRGSVLHWRLIAAKPRPQSPPC